MVKKYVQDSPNTVKVEFSEGCNLACTFCGINSIRERPGREFNYLTPAVAERVASEVARVGWVPRFEFAMHGEPSMNPRFVELLGIFRRHNPRAQLMMTSNGAGYLRDLASVDAAFAAGLNILALDDYINVKIVPKIVERYRGKVRVVNYPRSLRFSPYKRYPRGTRLIVVFQDISLPQDGVHNRLDNMGGMAAPRTNDQQGRRCVRPFRELAVRWNGMVATCCDDWRGQYVIGDLMTAPMDALWQSDAFMALRRKLYYGERDFGACNGCSDYSYRVGLLPDKRGLKSMRRVDARDKAVIQRALSAGPLARVVERPWEAADRAFIPIKEVRK